MTTLKSNLLKKGKKGFTLTELAIVIAVIAILIAVLVPTFSSVITKARSSNESVACKNEWTNFYIDADIAVNGTDDDYLVVYVGNSYSDSSNDTYYHGYLAESGVYDTETQYDVTINSTTGLAVCDSNTYKPIGTYEYMAGDNIIIYTNSKTSATIVTNAGSGSATIGTTYTITGNNLTVSGYNNTYYVTGTLDSSSNSSAISGLSLSNTSTAFYIRIYFPVAHNEMTGLAKAQVDSSGSSSGTGDLKYYGSTSGTYTISGTYTQSSANVTDALDSSSGDAYAYVDCILNGSYKQFVFDYYTGTTPTLAGTITIYNNATSN